MVHKGQKYHEIRDGYQRVVEIKRISAPHAICEATLVEAPEGSKRLIGEVRRIMLPIGMLSRWPYKCVFSPAILHG